MTIFATALVLAATAASQTACPVADNIKGRENIEWSIGYAYHVTDKNRSLPRVLMIGDSICNAYQSTVRSLLEGQVNGSYWVSSYCASAPSYLRMLSFYLDDMKYDVIHFNNGLHSHGTDPKVWAAAYVEALKMIRVKQPQAKIILVTSTPLKDPQLTEKVVVMNKVVRNLAAQHGYALNDLFALDDPYDRETYWTDVFHHNAELVGKEGEQVANAIRAALGIKANEK